MQIDYFFTESEPLKRPESMLHGIFLFQLYEISHHEENQRSDEFEDKIWIQFYIATACLDARSLLASFHGTGRYFACYERRKLTTNLTHIWTLLSTSLPCLTILLPLVQYCHEYCGSNQPLYNWLKGLIMSPEPVAR